MTSTSTAPPTVKPYQQLKRALEAAGCFERDGGAAVASLVVHVVAAAACYAVAAVVAARWGVLPSIGLCIFGSFIFFRIGWLMHDAAHGSACADVDKNEALAVACCAVLGEFLSGWRFGHNRHHAAPNVRGKDKDQSERWDARYRYPDTAAGAVVAALDLFFFHRFGRVVRVPKTLFLLGVRDGFYAHHANRRNFPRELAWVVTSQLAQLGACVALFGPWGVGIYLLHSHVGIVYLNAVFAGNHYDLAAYDEADAAALSSWELQVRTARNYAGGAVTAFVCGGLEHQIEHHLFPALPRAQLKRAAPIVKAWCAEHGLPYEALPLGASLARVVRFHLGPRPRPLQGEDATLH